MKDLYDELMSLRDEWGKRSGSYDIFRKLDELLYGYEPRKQKYVVMFRAVDPDRIRRKESLFRIYDDKKLAMESAERLNKNQEFDAHWVEEVQNES